MSDPLMLSICPKETRATQGLKITHSFVLLLVKKGEKTLFWLGRETGTTDIYVCRDGKGKDSNMYRM